ncbi:MAG: site-specific DNA-methyltransferase [Clostridia bacterium]|nr:site-specific DNA-methyltransferase [Clostridia bacterium]
MNRRKLTKEDIDKVRNIEGFPIGTDEDIIALSDPPYYTACPNPFIEDFIKEHGKPYDEATDTYHREPFAADVSEGKNDPIYNAHSYHTKVPYKAIMRYILHYTEPGDIVFDGFCGTGMTGVAAEKCAIPDLTFKHEIERQNKNIKWGVRYAILNDLSIAGTHISSNYVSPFSIEDFIKKAKDILNTCKSEFGWLYETTIPKQSNRALIPDGKGTILNTIWSSVITCPNCGNDLVYYNEAVDDAGNIADEFKCHHCMAKIGKRALKKEEVYYDDLLGHENTQSQLVPVLKIVKYEHKKYLEKICKFDEETLDKINKFDLKKLNIPTKEMLFRGGRWGDIYRSGYHKGYTHTHHFYSKRNLIAIGALYNEIEKCDDDRIRHMLMFTLTGILPKLAKTNRWKPATNTAQGPINGILYIPSFYAETNVFNAFKEREKYIEKLHYALNTAFCHTIVSNQSSSDLRNIPENSIDYIFVDPPFGDNIMYSESNFLWETWLRAHTNQKEEAIMNTVQQKNLPSYQKIMEECFKCFYKILKPNRWITIEFHNSKNAVWNAIQQALLQANFIVADVRILNKVQGSFKQVTTSGAVKQDLVISAYKPKVKFTVEFSNKVGTEETAWMFVRQHLSNIPVVVIKNGKIEITPERQRYLLFDRMVAYHIMQGIPVPIDSADFYHGLDEKFLRREDMYFLPEQVNEYDSARIKVDVETIQFELFVADEESAVSWLHQELTMSPKTYAELQPMFMQKQKVAGKHEIPELRVLLDENFIEDENTGKWYVPDRKKAGDIAKLREKNLLKEFKSYMSSKGRLKSFRLEAIRVGFLRLYKDGNFKAIFDLANRLPEQTIQDDPKLLMLYDVSSTKIS